MIKKLISIFGVLVFIGLIIIRINPRFTYTGLLSELSHFPDLRDLLHSVQLPNIPKIPVPDIPGFKQVVRGVNGMIEGLFSLAETTLSLGKVGPEFFKRVIGLVVYILTGF